MFAIPGRELGGLLGLAGQSSFQVQWKPCLKTVRHTPEADLWALHAYAHMPLSTYVHTDTYRNMLNKESSFSEAAKLTVRLSVFRGCEIRGRCRLSYRKYTGHVFTESADLRTAAVVD